MSSSLEVYTTADEGLDADSASCGLLRGSFVKRGGDGGGVDNLQLLSMPDSGTLDLRVGEAGDSRLEGPRDPGDSLRDLGRVPSGRLCWRHSLSTVVGQEGMGGEVGEGGGREWGGGTCGVCSERLSGLGSEQGISMSSKTLACGKRSVDGGKE